MGRGYIRDSPLEDRGREREYIARIDKPPLLFNNLSVLRVPFIKKKSVYIKTCTY